MRCGIDKNLQGTFCVHFSLFYTNVQILFTTCKLLKLYIVFHQEKKYKGYSFKTSQFSTIVAGNWQIQQRKEIRSFFCDYCCWNIQTFKSSEVKIWRNRQIEEYLSFFTSPHSLSHPIPSSVMYCEFQILLNHLVIKFSIMDPVILSDFNKKSQYTRNCVPKIAKYAHFCR